MPDSPSTATAKHSPEKTVLLESNRGLSAHDSFIFVINIGNILGILPVTNISKSKPEKSNFAYKSSKSLYTYFIILVCVLNSVLCFIYWTVTEFNFYLLATQMYYMNSILVLSLYVELARKWPKLMRKWKKIDDKMNGIYGTTSGLNRRIKIFALVIAILTIGEFILWSIYKCSEFYHNKNRQPSFKEYYEFAYPQYFFGMEFNFLTAGIATISWVFSGLIWSFNDLFIISISSALALRFKQITDRLAKDIGKTNPNQYWVEIRKDYGCLVRLSKKLDKKISRIVLLSFSANIFFLLIQLSNTVGNMKYDLEIVYYSCNFSFLIFRLVAVSLYAAWIKDESREPTNFLNSVSSRTYNTEIQRFLLQISFDDVGISGSKMFTVSRGLILSVAGAIVSYELVVIQFNKSFIK